MPIIKRLGFAKVGSLLTRYGRIERLVPGNESVDRVQVLLCLDNLEPSARSGVVGRRNRPEVSEDEASRLHPHPCTSELRHSVFWNGGLGSTSTALSIRARSERIELS